LEAYAYVRVSLAEEHPENQRLAITEWARTHGYTVAEWFEDIGVSGATPPWKRPGFSKLLDRVRQQPRPVLVYELSRLGRSFYETLRALQELEEKGSPVIAVSPRESFLQSLDPQVRKLVIAVLAWAAERERELLRQRTIEGMRRAKLEGKHVGRPRKPIDWRKFEEYRQKGLSLRDIARLLGVSYTTLRRRLKEYEEKKRALLKNS
jgi:putative DNA-invertase from lambdoid prophage Rac